MMEHSEEMINPDEIEDGGIWPLDRTTAEFIANNGKNVPNGHRWNLEECPFCKGQYIKSLGHRCEATLHIRMGYALGPDGKYHKINWEDYEDAEIDQD